MAPYSASSEFQDSDDYSDVDEDQTILRRGRQSLGISKRYVRSWKPGHAIREFYQNWKDAIVETARLHQKDLCPSVKGFDAKDVYTVEARHPVSKELLGFIRFKDGTLEFTNFKAQLSRTALDLGETSKVGNEQAAGTHGEGFKVASLVMVREGYRVQYEASNFTWTMKFAGRDKNMLYCFLRDMSETKIATQKIKYNARLQKGASRELKNNIWEDVSVKIGKVNGIGDKIEKVNFLKWIDVSLDLNRPLKMIDTPHGQLILDDAFKGRIYLKGLLLENSSTTKPFQFGYNFFNGTVDRDRKGLTHSSEEVSVLAQIWAAAIWSNEQDTLEKYVLMLRRQEAADVDQTEAYMSDATAKKVWEHLVMIDSEKKSFYHDRRNGDKDIEIIQSSLKKEPEQLPGSLWDALRKFHLVRTPQEQQRYLLQNAAPAEDIRTTFATTVQRGLRAAFALDSRTRTLNLEFKRGDKTDLSLLYVNGFLTMNDKWLDFQRSHGRNKCPLASEHKPGQSWDDYFECDHIVTDLYREVLEEIKRHPELVEDEVAAVDDSLHLKVCGSLRHMPIMITTEQMSDPGAIEVKWFDLDHDVFKVNGVDPLCRVVLHRESTCSARRDELLYKATLTEHLWTDEPLSTLPTEDTCGCHIERVPRLKSKVVFSGLDSNEKYFAMVSRNEHQEFLGVPPNSISPRTAPARSVVSPPIVRDYLGTRSQTAKKSPKKASSLGVHARSSSVGTQIADLYDDSPAGAGAVADDCSAADQDLDDDMDDNQGAGSTDKPEAGVESSVRKSTSPTTNQALQAIQEELSTHKQLVLSRDQEINGSKKKLLEQKDQLEANELALESLRLEIDSLKAQISRLQEQPTQNELELQAQGNHLREKEEDYNLALAEIESAQSILLAKQAEIDQLQQEEEVASRTIDNLRSQVQQLKDDNEDLEARLDEAEMNYDTQVRLAIETAERRRRRRPRHDTGKRGRESTEDDFTIKTEGSSKRQKMVITTAQKGIVDLTSDNDVSNNRTSTRSST